MSRVPPYTTRNRNGCIYFRVAVPRDLRASFPSTEIQRSLLTGSARDARLPAILYWLQASRLFEVIRQMPPKERQKLHQTNFELGKLVRHADGRIEIEGLKVDPDKASAEIAALKATIEAVGGRTAPNSSAPPVPDSIALSELIDRFCTSQVRDEHWTEKTAAENRAIFALLLRVVGNLPVQDVTAEVFDQYREKLRRLPPNLNKSQRFRGRMVDEVLAMSNVTSASVNTINKNLSQVSSLMSWAVRRRYLTVNPAQGMLLKNRTSARDERHSLSGDELRKLFHSVEYQESRHGKPHRYWAPLMALYTGARQNEIAQLASDDFVEVEGIRAISITDEGVGQKLKTDSAKRFVPLHPVLIDLGLWEFVELLKKRKVPRLFMELPLSRDGYGKPISKWYARYRQCCGVIGKGRDFHSFRHTFADYLTQSRIEEVMVADIIGHKVDSQTFGRYGKAYRLKIVKEVIDAIIYPGIAPEKIPRFRFSGVSPV